MELLKNPIIKKIAQCIINIILCVRKKTLNKEYIDEIPIIEVPDSLLDKRLLDCTLLLAHNAYYSDIFLGGAISSIESIKRVINIGIRAFELDIHDRHNRLELYHYSRNIDIETSSRIPFDNNLCTIINNIAWKRYIDYPLFICLELDIIHKQSYNALANILANTFGDKLFIRDSNKSLAEYTIDELRNKVIIIALSKYTTGISESFDKIISVSSLFNKVYENNNYENIMTHMDNKKELINKTTTLRSVYPHTTFTAKNYDIQPFRESGYNFIGVDIQTNNDNYTKIKSMFNNFKSPILY
jgi:hypothetical protein